MENPPSKGGRGHMRPSVARRALISAILLACVVFIITSNEFWRWMYPISYQTDIQQASSASHVDPLMIASIIRVESQFKNEDISHAGAIGLMQLMPDTAQWIAGQMQQTGAEGQNLVGSGQPADLSVPSANIRLGAWYVHHLVEVFNGNQVAAIAAYNAGPKRVSTWLQSGVWNGNLQTINDIPVGETRHFVDRVFYNYDLYKRIYGRDAGWQQEA